MNEPGRRWLDWPGWSHLRFATVLALVGGLWFAFVYVGADWITSRRTSWWVVQIEVEQKIPFVPEMIVIYVSLYSLFLIAPFVLRTRRELLRVAVGCNLAVLLAGVSFILVPAELTYPPVREFGAFPQLFRSADQLNLTYNLVPSLHVAFAVLLGGAFGGNADRTGRRWLWTWVLAIAVSTLLTHQHHVIDVVTGALLGYLIHRWVYLPGAIRVRKDSQIEPG